MKRAFTLIELLVVIAIIAILASILFPVFAQAKAAAKHTVEISNDKQEALAVLMYSGDADDNFPLGTEWNTGNDALCYGAGACFTTWAEAIQPYVKNVDLFMDPLAPPNSYGAAQQPIANLLNGYYIQFGYNYTYLSPYLCGTPTECVTSTSDTAPAKPADTVMVTTKWANAENTSGYDWGTGFPGGMLAAAAVDSPDCYTIPQWCLNGWGLQGFYDQDLHLPDAAGASTGGNAHRYANQIVVSWCDGHTSSMPPGALAIGSNWTPTAPSGVIITDLTTYLWDLQ